MFGSSKKCFGVDISDFSVEVLALQKIVGGYKIKSYARSTLEPGLVENGNIINIDRLAAKLKQLLLSAQPKSVTDKNVAFSLPESQIFSAVINLPVNLTEASLKEAVENQIPEIFPFSLEQLHYSWKVLNILEKEQQVLIAAVPLSLFKQYISLAEKLDCKIISLEMESIAAYRSVINQVKNNEGVLLLDMGARSTNICIFNSQGLYSSYTTNIAGQKFTQALAKKMKISEAEAEKIKIAHGFDTKKNSGQILIIVQEFLQKILPDIKKSVNHFEAKTGSLITNGYLVGGSSLLPGLAEYLASNLKIKIMIGNPFTNIKNYDKIIKQKQAVLYANVVGLALKISDKKAWQDSINFI